MIQHEIGTEEEDFREKMAEFFGVSTDDFNPRRLGLCQACAFQSNDPKRRMLAESCFRDALNCFTDENDIERTWVYLGHLACDFPDEGQSLWDEAESHLDKRLDPLMKPFVFAVFAKGSLVFGNATQKLKRITKMGNMLQNCPEEILQFHPYGLIFQTLAMLHADKGNVDRATELFHRAGQSLASGSNLLETLAVVSCLRSMLFLAEQGSLDAETSELLQNDVEALKQRLPIKDVSALPLDPLEAARSLLNTIRFNYW